MLYQRFHLGDNAVVQIAGKLPGIYIKKIKYHLFNVRIIIQKFSRPVHKVLYIIGKLIGNASHALCYIRYQYGEKSINQTPYDIDGEKNGNNTHPFFLFDRNRIPLISEKKRH